MNDQNLDVNLIIQAFQEKVSQLATELVVKEATIKQLTMQLTQPKPSNDEFETPVDTTKKVK
jgi:hypothetical protein